DAMVVHEIVDAVGHRDTEVFRPREPRRAGIAIRDSDDLNRRNEMEEVEKSGPSSPGSKDRHFGRGKLRHQRSVRQRLHTCSLDGGEGSWPSPTSYQRRDAQRCASSLWSMARATDSRSFSPSTGLTR